jgi:hypothetical protein
MAKAPVIRLLSPSGSGDSASADAERRRLLSEWAANVLTATGVAGAIEQVKSIAELGAVAFNLDDTQVILAIHDALFPATGEPMEHFRRFTKKQLGAILRNQFDELKRYRRIALERAPSSAGAAHPFDSPEYDPASLVTSILAQYLAMESHVLDIFALLIILTHVYVRFGIAPRVALVSETPDAGKTTAWKIARHLVFRPNPEASATGAAIGQFFNEGPGTFGLDESDLMSEAKDRKRMQQVWNLGHEEGSPIAFVIGGKRTLVSTFGMMFAAGIGRGFLIQSQVSRTFMLEMASYDKANKPPRDWRAPQSQKEKAGWRVELDAIREYLEHWGRTRDLKLNPPLPAGALRRAADNIRGLCSIADACGGDWPRRAREALTLYFEGEKTKQPKIALLRHGVEIFNALGLDMIASVRFNAELRKLDLPDARWSRFRGVSGGELAHPIQLFEQAALLELVGVKATRIRPPGEAVPRVQARPVRGGSAPRDAQAWALNQTVPPSSEGRHACHTRHTVAKSPLAG